MARRQGRLSRFKESIAGPLQVLRSPVSVCVIVAVTVIGAAVIAWHKYGDQILQNPKWVITSDQIEITAPPDWIRSDIKAEVVRDSSLERMSILDRNLVQKVGDAFAIHSWVADVRRARKHTDRIVVELEYRRPVAMVEVVTNSRRGLIPVDRDGVILPTADFSPNQTRDYLRLSIRGVKSFGVVGTPWDDERVLDSAGISAAWDSKWKPLGLYRIVAIEVTDIEQMEPSYIYEIHTRQGVRVIWGQATGKESTDEATAAQKVALLVKHAEEHGPLDESNHATVLDVRSGKITESTARTAQKTRN